MSGIDEALARIAELENAVAGYRRWTTFFMKQIETLEREVARLNLEVAARQAALEKFATGEFRLIDPKKT